MPAQINCVMSWRKMVPLLINLIEEGDDEQKEQARDVLNTLAVTFEDVCGQQSNAARALEECIDILDAVPLAHLSTAQCRTLDRAREVWTSLDNLFETSNYLIG